MKTNVFTTRFFSPPKLATTWLKCDHCYIFEHLLTIQFICLFKKD